MELLPWSGGKLDECLTKIPFDISVAEFEITKFDGVEKNDLLADGRCYSLLAYVTIVFAGL